MRSTKFSSVLFWPLHSIAHRRAVARLATVAVALPLAGALSGGASGFATQERSAPPGGAALYQAHCASCHGDTARGDGPMVSTLRRKVPDLTGLARRNGNVFPRELVARIVDGRQRVSGHGGPDMPVWGLVFRRSPDGGDKAAVDARIRALVDYLAGLQVREGE